MTRIALCLALALAPAYASADSLPVTIVATPGFPVHLDSCSVNMSSSAIVSSPMQAQMRIRFHVGYGFRSPMTPPSDTTEITWLFANGRTSSHLFNHQSRNVTSYFSLPTDGLTPVAARCALVFVRLEGGHSYLAPWIPVGWRPWNVLPAIPAFSPSP